MNIENEIFKRTMIDFDKLISYGFNKEGNNYIYQKTFMNNSFKAVITIHHNGTVIGKIYDLDTSLEYLNFRIETAGAFAKEVKAAYVEILNDIKKNCCIANYFISNQANRITNYILKKYHNLPEFLWPKYPYFGIFRNSKNNKWYAIIMNVDKAKITNGRGEIEIINLKLSNEDINTLIKEKGYYLAYHMSKRNWITIILDDTLSDDIIIKYLDISYNNIAG